MTPSTIDYTVTKRDLRLAHFASVAIAFSVAEAAFPLPLPGVKPGLANIVTLWVFMKWGWKDAAWVTLLRVFGSDLLLGQLLAPGFFLALAGALASLSALKLTGSLPARWFGPLTHSIIAALAHICGQLLVARLWLIPHNGLFYLFPIFAVTSLFFGTLNGLIVAKLLVLQQEEKK